MNNVRVMVVSRNGSDDDDDDEDSHPYNVHDYGEDEEVASSGALQQRRRQQQEHQHQQEQQQMQRQRHNERRQKSHPLHVGTENLRSETSGGTEPYHDELMMVDGVENAKDIENDADHDDEDYLNDTPCCNGLVWMAVVCIVIAGLIVASVMIASSKNDGGGGGNSSTENSDGANAAPAPTPTPTGDGGGGGGNDPTNEDFRCGCESCTSEMFDLETSDGKTCGYWIETIQFTDPHRGTELAACSHMATEFPECAPACDPLQCDEGKDMSRVNLVELSTTYPVYCFPPYEDRLRWEGVWGNYIVEAKESEYEERLVCGPGDNKFSRETVSVSGNELTLQYKQVEFDGETFWSGSEVRVAMPTNQDPFHYGTYTFSVQSVAVTNAAGERTAHNLPPSIILGLFTWDDTERFDISENYLHEVDVEISRWGDADAEYDAQFLVQPPESPQWYNFSTAVEGRQFNQGGQTYSFTWNPGVVSWETTAGIGHTFSYSTEDALSEGVTDRVQCMPADVEIRMNLWNMFSIQEPHEMAPGDVVTVVIDSFEYTPSGETSVPDGGVCSKDCQCAETSHCTKSNTCAPLRRQ